LSYAFRLPAPRCVPSGPDWLHEIKIKHDGFRLLGKPGADVRPDFNWNKKLRPNVGLCGRLHPGVAGGETGQIAAEMLLAAVEGSGPLMFAEIAMRKALKAGKQARS
jgi:hypothetical protein